MTQPENLRIDPMAEHLARYPGAAAPAHLSAIRTGRGFAHLPALDGVIGCESVQVYESSLATQQCIWLRATEPRDRNRPNALLVNEVTVELALETAAKLRDQLDWLIDNHYQNRYEAGDDDV